MTSPPRGVTSAAPAVTSSSGGVSAVGGESDMVVPARSAEESFIRFFSFYKVLPLADLINIHPNLTF